MKRELHVISNGKLTFEQMAAIAAEIVDHADYIHIRERNKTTKELYEGVMLLIQRGISPAKLVINDRIDIALLTGVNRVQLGYTSVDVRTIKDRFPHIHVGCSVHSLEEALRKQQEGADSALYGHIFATRSKDGVPPRGLEELQEIATTLTIPVTAIGGIVPTRVKAVLCNGASGVAVMSSIWDASHPLEVAKEYREQIQRWEKSNEQSI